jgi:hypothetical protein
MKDSLTMSKLEQTNSIFKTPYSDVYINYSASAGGVSNVIGHTKILKERT